MARGTLAPKEWQDRIKLGEKFRREYGDSDAWPRYWEYYRNRFGEGELPLNVIFSSGRSLVPRIYFRNPRVTVTPMKPGLWWQAKVLERVDNWILREIKLKKHLKKVALDAYLYGVGIVKLGYDSEFGFSLDEVSETGGYLSAARTPGGEIEYDVNVKPGMPWAKRISPAAFVVPWGTEDIEDVPWVAHRIVRPLEDVKRDPRYEHTKDLKGNLKHKPLVHNRDRRADVDVQTGAADEFVGLWEIHDVKRHRVYVIADDYDQYLRDVEDDLAIEGLPYEVLQYNPDSDYFWAVADPTIIEPQQHELNHARRMQALHERLAAVKMIAKRDSIKQEEVDKLVALDQDPMPVVWVEGDLQQSVAPFTAHTPQDYTLYVRELRQDVREQIGFSRNQMGEFDLSTRRTATEAAIVEQAAGIRVDERRDAIADVFEGIVRKINQMIFSFWTAERVVSIVGPDGRAYWVSFTGEEIRGEYSYKIDPESSLPVTNEARKREVVEVFSALKGVPGLNTDALIRMFLSHYEWADAETLLSPLPAAQGVGGEQAVPLSRFIAEATRLGGANAAV